MKPSPHTESQDPNCPNCDGEGWVYEDDEMVPFRGALRLGPGALCPVCMGGLIYADPEAEKRKLSARRAPNSPCNRA